MFWTLVMLWMSVSAAESDSGEPTMCSRHRTQAMCMVFRRQEKCAWDGRLEQCVAELPCEARTPTDCEYELTTGSSPWE